MSVRSHPRTPHRRRRRTVMPLLAGTLALVVAAGCGQGDDRSAEQDPTVATDAGTTVSTRVPATADPGAVLAAVPWFVQGESLVPGQARFVTGPDVARALLDQLLAGPTEADVAAGLTTGIGPRVQVTSLTVDGGTAIVDLNRAFETADTQPQVGQVVWTLTEIEGIDRVKFLVDGEDNGATGTRPIDRAGTRLQPAG